MLDEQKLLAQVATGDEEALYQLFLSYRPRLRRYLWHQLDGEGYAAALLFGRSGVKSILLHYSQGVWSVIPSGD